MGSASIWYVGSKLAIGGADTGREDAGGKDDRQIETKVATRCQQRHDGEIAHVNLAVALVFDLLVGLPFIGQAGGRTLGIGAGVVGPRTLKLLAKVYKIYSELDDGALELRQPGRVVKNRRRIIGLGDKGTCPRLGLAAIAWIGNSAGGYNGFGPSQNENDGGEGKGLVHQKS